MLKYKEDRPLKYYPYIDLGDCVICNICTNRYCSCKQRLSGQIGGGTVDIIISTDRAARYVSQIRGIEVIKKKQEKKNTMKTLNNIIKQIDEILEKLKIETDESKRELLLTDMERLASIYDVLNTRKEVLHG